LQIVTPGTVSVVDPERFGTVFDAYYGEIRRYIGRRLDLDVAEALGIAYGTVASRLSRARTKLHKSLGVEIR
jgi:RNA polymerase sigma-70 factor (ECF subfamily)